MKKLVFLLLSIILLNCASTNYATQGKVIPKDFHFKTTFTTLKTVIVLPCNMNGSTKNFLFDTGAQLTVIQRDSIFGKRFVVRGATNRTTESGSETIKDFKIGTVNFTNTFANNSNLVGLKEQIPNFGGVIGRPIIDKANWLINYPEKLLEISNKNLVDKSFYKLPMEFTKTGAPYTFLTINGKQYKTIIDLGSSSTLNVPKNHELAKVFEKTIDLKTNKRDRYTVGGLQQITEKIGIVPEVSIGQIAFKDSKLTINTSSQLRIGNNFFKDCIVYIDSANKAYRIKKLN
ncbi:pepsin/retropepsin-like aspartic protease family protein [Seonamhaeicola marinus]|uniref:Peptidase A2 domain-containing protein n=1 Tax=Seonamhaeicola marinus TaxID=1912246 RepID=A0A5D0IM43_9FLAO|nr:hypothetical protein [Seonamhaeicola marinus]TYA84248.1 hypothetical protein FUA24_06260 [Seonamhaeicola marinus]